MRWTLGGPAGSLAMLALFARAFARFVCGPCVIGSCRGREGAAEHLIDTLTQAAKAYEIDFGEYPPGHGTGSAGLCARCHGAGPRGSLLRVCAGHGRRVGVRPVARRLRPAAGRVQQLGAVTVSLRSMALGIYGAAMNHAVDVRTGLPDADCGEWLLDY
jgi:hypothetical protein